MTDLKELFDARTEMDRQHALYRPTAFWAEASRKMVDDFEEHGMENFRALTMPLNFFVPTFGTPGSGFSQNAIDGVTDYYREKVDQSPKQLSALDQFFGGYNSALADYRVLLAGDDKNKLPHFHSFSESTVGNPKEHFEFDGRNFSRSSLNYLLGLCFLKKHLGNDVPRTVLEIGGGFGSLGEIMFNSNIDGMRYIDIDIPPTSYASQYYLSETFGTNNVATFKSTQDKEEIIIDELPPLSVLCSWQIEKLKGQVDLFVNFISFQEMEPPVVENYLSHVKRLGSKWILLRNLREGKQKKISADSLGVETPILDEDYAKMLPEYDFVDRNVFPFGFQTVDGFHSELYLFRRK